MARITIHLPDGIEQRVRQAAKSSGKTVSRWIADRLAEDLDTWPASVLNAASAFPDFPSLEEIRKGLGGDSRRETA